MKKTRSTKHALLMSALALLLCVSMFIGSTFAWFTESITSANNIIKSGNLDIKFEYAVFNDDGTFKEWKDVKDASDILTNNLWEPGATEVAYLRIANAGSLALKYRLGVNIVLESAGVNKDGETFKLSDYIHFGVVEDVNAETDAYAEREDAIDAVVGAQKISAGYTKSSKLYPVDNIPTDVAGAASEKYLALVVYMPTTVENEANHDGNTIPLINLGINVFATQLVAEDDSFGPDYDEDANEVNFVVTNEGELVAAFAEAKNGDVIGISGNVTWTTGGSHGSTPFVENATTFALRPANDPLTYVTLQGIGPDATFTAIGDGVGPVGIDNGTVIFRDLKIVDQSVSYNESAWELGYLEFRGNTVFENCNVVNAIMMEGDSAKFIDCDFNSHDDNQYAVWVSNGEASFEGCTFTGARGLKVHEDYGTEVVSVSVNNSAFVELSKKPGLAIGDIYMNGDTYTSGSATYTNTTDTAISLTNNKFIGTQPGDQDLYKYEYDTVVTTFTFVDKNNTVIKNEAGLPAGLYRDENGTYYATTTAGLNAGIDKAEDDDEIVLAADVAYTGNGYANITKDITLNLNGNTISTTSLGVVAKAGTIKNGTVTNPVGSRAALRTWSGVSIENVTVVSPKNGGITVAEGNTLPSIKNVTIEAQTYGIELQYGASVGSIENVTIVAGKNGIVAQAATIGEIKNCTINGEECGVWGQLKGTEDLLLNFTNSTVSGKKYGIYLCDEGATIVPDGVAKLTYDATVEFDGGVKDQEFAFGQSGKLFINGAKVGAFISTADELFAFAKAVNEGGNTFSGLTVFLTADIDLENATWTPIGQAGATQFKGIFDGQGHTIKNLNIDSSAQTGEHYSSGLFGWAESGVTIKNVNVDGATVVGNHNVAVIVGYTYSGKISNCHVTNANIVCKHVNDDACGDKCGLIAGYSGNESRFSECSASNSTVTAGRDAGQLLGLGYNVSVSNCSATNVTVTATGECTGNNINEAIIGRVMG